MFRKKIFEILDTIDFIKTNDHKLYGELVALIKLKVSSHLTIDCDLKKLAEYFDIECKNLQQKPWFTSQQLNQMIEHSYQKPDFLRDIAILLRDRSDFQSAKKFINKAHELRPNGPVIIKLKNEMDELI